MPPRTVNPLDNPAKANAEIKNLLDSSPDHEVPEPELPPPDLVTLPGGLVKGSDFITTATVRELTGEHEEQLARASQSMNPFHFVDTLLKCGTKQVGSHAEHMTESLLKDLLIGDRDFLIMEIRRATYGDIIEVPDWECPECTNKTDLTLNLDDIPMTRLDDTRNDLQFEVPLRKGRRAKVRLANGHDQHAMFENPKLNQAERNTVLISRCVTSITDQDGQENSMIAWKSMALHMSIPDRKSVLKELTARQPGPRYNEVKFTHKDCGKEVTLSIGIGDLFLDI